MNSSPLQTELATLFEQRNFQSILDRAERDEITPATNPHAANIVAAALFQIGRYTDCLLWCEALSPSLNNNASFVSMYGAVLRRVGRLDEAEKAFRAALSTHSDNPFLRNNFANLLIDLQEFDEAESILNTLIEENPNYEDAQSNLNRLQFQRSLKNSVPKTDHSAAPEQVATEGHLIDPLAAAFSDEEVAIAGGIASRQAYTDQTNTFEQGLNSDVLPSRDLELELQETISLARQTVEADPQQVIRDCALLHSKLGVQAPIYEVAAEAYIRLQLFGDAETCLLVAHSLGSTEASISLNLANLAAMRGDQRLALQWLEQLARHQPDHPQLDAVRKTLFPNGAPKTSSTPFQINLNQRAPGNFTELA